MDLNLNCASAFSVKKKGGGNINICIFHAIHSFKC